jgi:phenylalanine ammonia-lyase
MGNCRPVYEFVRVTLGIRMYGIDNLNSFQDGFTEITIGQNVSLIYEAIRDGQLRDVIVGLFHQ